MKRQSKLNRFVDITARVIIGLLLCVALELADKPESKAEEEAK